MSEDQTGPGWWQATDGKWYPPESHPSYTSSQPPTLPPPAPFPGRHQSNGTQTTTPQITLKTPLWRRWWLLLGAAVVAVGLVAVVAMTGRDERPAASDDNSRGAPRDSGSDVSQESGSPAASPTRPPSKAEGKATATPLAPNANPALAVAGVDTLPAGTPGQLSIIAQAGTLDRSGSLPIVVRNLTDRPVADLAVTGTARDSSGALVGSGSDQGLNPFIVGPGEIAIGYVYFGLDGLPPGATFDLSVTGTDPSDVFAGEIDLVVAEHNRTSDSIVVMLRNDTDKKASGPIGLILMCFDDTDMPTTTQMTFTDQDDAPPAASVSATFNFFGEPPCDRYIVGGSGYDF